jgi:hypothetical protein
MDQFDAEGVSAECSATMIGRPDQLLDTTPKCLIKHTDTDPLMFWELHQCWSTFAAPLLCCL